jgi:hypothetical protein
MNLASLFSGGANSASQPLIQALLAKHGGGGLPALPTVDGPPKVGPDVGPPDLTDASARTGNVLGALDMGNPNDLGADAMSGIKSSLAANAAKPRGFLDRIGDFLHSDEGRAQAMRFAAGAFKGGMGGGLEAATSFADKRHHEAAETASAEADRAMKTQELGDNRAWHLGQLDNEAAQNAETTRHNQAGEGNAEYGINSENWRHTHPSGDASLRSRTDIYKWLHPSADTVTTQTGENYRHGTASGDTVTTQAGENYRHDNPPPVPTPPGYTETSTTTDPVPKSSGFLGFGGHPAAPKTVVTTRTPVRPSEVQPTSGAPTKVSSDEEYNALPSGSRFIGPDGQVRVKP